MLFALLPLSSFALGNNSLTIYNIADDRDTHNIHEAPSGDVTPQKGALYSIWRVGEKKDGLSYSDLETLLNQLKQMTLGELDQEYPHPERKVSTPTDEEGMTFFSQLEDGLYYVQELQGQTNIYGAAKKSVPFLVNLPLSTPSGEIIDVKVYPKSHFEIPPLGGENFIKVDAANKPLAGARFKVLQRIVDEKGHPLQDEYGNFLYQSLQKNGEEIILVSGENGKFYVDDLPYSTYWLVETGAPAGYSLLPEPLEFQVDKNTLEDLVEIKIINHKIPKDTPPGSDPHKPPKGLLLPKTGDVQLYLILLVGIALILLGSWILRESRI